jgi:hypothetical protein
MFLPQTDVEVPVWEFPSTDFTDIHVPDWADSSQTTANLPSDTSREMNYLPEWARWGDADLTNGMM